MAVNGFRAQREKRDAYEAASRLSRLGDDASLRYAALELRRCLEAIVYDKLTTYGELLPEASVYRWQPSKAFDALIQMEPEAQETFTYAVGPQKDLLTPSNGPFQQIGLDERPRAKWVKDTWNKLGFYLHAEWPFAKRKKAPASLSEFLEKTLDEIAPLVANAFSATLIPTIEFYCQACKTKVKVMQKSVAASGGAVCLTCGMQYRAERTGNSITFFPDAPPFVCDCGESTYLPFDEVRAGYEFGCRVCSRRYVIAGPQWLYRLVGDGNLESDADTQQGQVEQSGCSQE